MRLSKRYINRICTAFLTVVFTFTANGETLEEVKAEYDELIEKQESQMAMLEGIYYRQNRIKEQIAGLDKQLSNAQVDIDNIDNEMMELIVKINNAQNEYDKAKQKRQQQCDKASERLRYIYESGTDTDYFKILSECRTVSEYCIYKQYITDIMEYDAQLIDELRETEELMKTRLDEIKEGNRAKEVLEQFKSDKEIEMAAIYEERVKLLDEYRNDAEAMEEELNETTAASDRVYEILVNMENNIDFVNTYTGGRLEWPVEGRYYVSSGYVGRMSPVGNGYEFHTGIDIPAPSGYEISAAGDGIVITAGWINGYGNTVIISHGNGLTTLYGHNSELLVSEGATVNKGDAIALCGSTGYATGNHCHFEVRINGEHTDPWEYLKRE